jgi:hypothetical protein
MNIRAYLLLKAEFNAKTWNVKADDEKKILACSQFLCSSQTQSQLLHEPAIPRPTSTERVELAPSATLFFKASTPHELALEDFSYRCKLFFARLRRVICIVKNLLA